LFSAPQKGYRVFRTLGLRHMIVVNMHNQVQGIITRDDLVRTGNSGGADAAMASSNSGSSGQTDARSRRRRNRRGRSRIDSNSPVLLVQPIERANV
jgi:CBS domain-containing protein